LFGAPIGSSKEDFISFGSGRVVLGGELGVGADSIEDRRIDFGS
jgi:hypothetical protein